MAFVLDRMWDESDPALEPAVRSDALGRILADPRLRRACATLLSAVVHVLLIWMLLNKLAGGSGPGEAAGPGQRGLMQFDLSDPASASATAEQQAVRQAAPVTSEVDVSAASDLPPPEWTISRLPPAAEPQPPPPAPTAQAGSAAAAGTSGAGAGAGHGRGAGYDPYAGAAPQWRSSQERAGDRSPGGRVLGFVGLGLPSAGGLTLDEGALEAIGRRVAVSIPGAGGTVELVLRVSPTGVVLQATPRAGSAPREAKDAFARALLGKRLYLGSASRAQTIALPPISLG